GAALGERALEIQRLGMGGLGGGVEAAWSPIVGRGRYGGFLAVRADGAVATSPSERIVPPHAASLVDDMLAKTADVFRDLRVYPDRMRTNLDALKGQAAGGGGREP